MKRDDTHLLFIFILYVLIIECIFAEYQLDKKTTFSWVFNTKRLIDYTL